MGGGLRESVAMLWRGELCVESTNTAWKAKLEGVNVENVEMVWWGGGEEERGWTCEKQR
jgi:hypothetical protein